MDLPGINPTFWSLLGQVADGARIALVGGAVRDLLLHLHHRDPWRGLPDLDLVLDGAESVVNPNAPAAAIAFAQRLVAMAGDVEVREFRTHIAYGTAELTLALPDWMICSGEPLVQLDLATARVEEYPVPAGNPCVSFGSLETDLARRDFTVNAMALLLHAESAEGFVLMDPHHGQNDLVRKELRFLHGASVMDDPTRLVRAARYAVKLGFALAADSRAQVAATLDAWPWNWKLGDEPELAPAALSSRLRMELDLLLNQDHWVQSLAVLQEWGGFLLLDPNLQRDRHWRRRVHWACRLGLPPLLALVAGASEPLKLSVRLRLSAKQQQQLIDSTRLWHRLQAEGWNTAATPPCTPSEWCDLVEGMGICPEAAIVLVLQGRGPRRALLRWALRWRNLMPPMRGRDLIHAGMTPGPGVGVELRKQRKLLLDGQKH